jgi:uncharacterized protein
MGTIRYVLAAGFAFMVMACKPGPTDTPSAESPGFDPGLAQRLGADEYGMRTYVVAFLRAGPNRDQDDDTVAKLQRTHLDNIRRLANDGKLVLAGPFMDDGDLRGIYVFDVETIEEAQALTETDPAIQAGRLVMELHPWYGSAAVKEVSAIHERIAEKNP